MGRIVKVNLEDRKIGSSSEHCMSEAVQLVLSNKWSLRKAADHTGVKFQTLARYVNKQKAAGNNHVRMTPNYAVRRVFTDADEQELAEYIKTTARMCFGLTTVDTRKLAFEMAQKNNLDFPQQWSENKLAGKDWLRGFIQRNPRISIRQPEACSLSRMTSFNKHNVNQFYENLRLIYSRNSSVLCAATRIFNLDETATPTVSAPKAILAEKGVKQISKATSGERGLLITTCAIVCAAGTFLPPAMVFPRCNFKSHMLNGAPPGTLGLAQKSGWMNSELFSQVMEHFIKHSLSSKENPSLLIFDNHESHMSLKVLDLARENGVTILTLPPHCSHKMQPLDVSVFFPFKSFYRAAMDSWMLQNAGQPCTLYNVAQLVGIAHMKSMTPSNIVSGFKHTGIFPFDPNIFSEDDFLLSYVTDRPLETTSLNISTGMNSNVNLKDHSSPGNSVQNEYVEWNADNSAPADQDFFLDDITGEIKSNQSCSSDGGPTVSNKKISTPLNKASNKGCVQFSPEDIRAYPKALPRKSKAVGRKKGKSTILTDTPEKMLVEQKELAHCSRKRPKNIRKKSLFGKKKKESFSSSDDEDLLPLNFINHLGTSPGIGDFVLHEIKKNVFYVAELLSEVDEDGDFEVSYLRKSSKHKNKFVKPSVLDLASAPKDEIKYILPPAIELKNKRYSSLYSFAVQLTGLDVR